MELFDIRGFKLPEEDICHHGVKGMKWGVRRYQNPDGSLTDLGKKRAKDTRKNRRVEKTIQQYIASGKAKVDNLKNYTVGEAPNPGWNQMTTYDGVKYLSGLTDARDFDKPRVYPTQKKEGGGFILRGNTISDYGSGWKYKTAADLIGLMDGQPRGILGFSSNDPIHESVKNGQVSEGALRSCNRGGFGQQGRTQNCSKCSSALELLKRGFAVTAGQQTYPSSTDAVSLWWKGAKRIDYSYDDAEDALKSYGPGTSGTLSIQYGKGRGGHSLHWTNDNKGVFEIQDGQTGQAFNSLKSLQEYLGFDTSLGVTTHRLDNCEPNLDNMAIDSVIELWPSLDQKHGSTRHRPDEVNRKLIDISPNTFGFDL